MSTEMPRRPKEHNLETASARAFVDSLPNDWTAQPRGESVEYGVDFDVEIFDEGYATGLRFPVQLKGAESLGGKEPTRVIKWSTWNYWSSHDAPVLVVLWERKSGSLWWKWAHHHDPYYSRKGTKTFTFKFDANQTWNEETPTKIAREVRAWRAWQRADTYLPIELTIEAHGEVADGVSSAGVAAEARQLLLPFSSVFQLRHAPSADLHLRIVIDKGKIVLSASGGPTTTLHCETAATSADMPAAVLQEQLAADIVMLLATHLLRFHVSSAGAKLAGEVVETATVVFHPGIARSMIGLLAGGGRLERALVLLRRLLDSDTPAGAGAYAGLLDIRPSLTKAEVRQVVKAFADWADDSFGLSDSNSAASLTYNAARILDRDDLGETIRLMRLAADRQTEYRAKAYWWRELAGYLFLAGQYGEAADSYQHAHELGDSESFPQQADALMFAGRYAEALNLFSEYLTATEDPESVSPEWILKYCALDFFSREFGIERQERRPGEAGDDSNRVAGMQSLREILVEKDLLCGHALFQLGLLVKDSGGDPLDWVIAAAVCEPDNPVAWMNAIFEAFERESPLLTSIVITAKRFAGAAMVDLVLRNDDLADVAVLLQELLDQTPDKPEGPVEIRVLDEDHKVLGRIDAAVDVESHE